MKPTWIRRAAMAVGAVLLLLVVIAITLVASFDANRHKAWAIDWMQARHQRTLAIDGPVALSLFPRLAVTVSGLRLSERGRADEFLAVDELALAVQTLPLLRRQLVVDRVHARGVRATYLRAGTGPRNIDDLAPGGRSGDAPAAAPLRFDMRGLELQDLQLRVRDEQAGLDGELALQSLTVGALAPGRPAPVALRATLQLARPQALKLALDGRMQMALDLGRGSVEISALKLDAQGDAAGLRGLALALEGALAWDGGTLRAAPLRLALQGGTLGAVSFAPSTLAFERAQFSPGSGRLELAALKLALAGRHGAQAFELALAWPEASGDARSLQAGALSGSFRLAGGTTLEGSVGTGPLAGSLDALRLPALAVVFKGSAGPRALEGRLGADLVLAPARRSATIEGLDLRATLAPQAGAPPLQLSLAGRAGADLQALHWTLAGALNGQAFDSQGRVVLTGAVPQVQAQARFTRLDLDSLLPAAGPGPAATAPATAAPLPYTALRSVDGRFDLAAGALAWRQYRGSDLTLDATLAQGRLHLTRLAGRAWGGQVQASGSAEADAQRVAIKLAASGVDVDALIKDLSGKALLEGRGSINAELGAQGASLAALRGSLAGTVALRVRDGAVQGINLARVLRQVKAAVQLKQDAIIPARATEKTDFYELTASAHVAGGVAQSDDLDLKAPFLRIGGAGRVDIGRGWVDYTARATVVASAAGQGADELAALRGLTVPVQLSGPFDRIDWKVRWSDVASAAVENRLRQKLAEELGRKLGVAVPAGAATDAAASAPTSAPASPKDRLRDKLKGLLR